MAGAAFPVLRDLCVDRTAFDRIIQAGGFVSVNTGGPRRQRDPGAEGDQEVAMDAAECIGCGACVAACPNASAMLFLGAKVSHLGMLPQGEPERTRRVRAMVAPRTRRGSGTARTSTSAKRRARGDQRRVHRKDESRIRCRQPARADGRVGQPLVAPVAGVDEPGFTLYKEVILCVVHSPASGRLPRR